MHTKRLDGRFLCCDNNDMQSAKDKVTTAVTEYKRLFPQEYKQFLKSNQITIGKQSNSWASANNKDGNVQRLLFETPEKLYSAINRLLTTEEKDWWNARGAYIKNFDAAGWFIKKFPEFKVTKEF